MSGKASGGHALAIGNGVLGSWLASVATNAGRTLAEKRAAERDAERVTGTTPTLPAGRYAGTYSDELYGTITVSGDSEMRLHYGPGLTGRLEHWHYDTFRAHWDAEWRGSTDVTFRIGADGEVSTLEVGGSTFARE